MEETRMRYNVHPPRNRITRSLGVLVGAALVATLGLPSAAQAQTPSAPKVTAQATARSAPTAWLHGQLGAGALTALPDTGSWLVTKPERRRDVATRAR